MLWAELVTSLLNHHNHQCSVILVTLVNCTLNGWIPRSIVLSNRIDNLQTSSVVRCLIIDHWSWWWSRQIWGLRLRPDVQARGLPAQQSSSRKKDHHHHLVLTVNLSRYNRVTGTAEARLFSMFKFPDSNRVHFQCDIVICKGAMMMVVLIQKSLGIQKMG